ncbi:hypothetical protein CBS101457_002460 [Exobasidium rhododendri]|nr:hypothetical protein CBS101457_002460 [Exobasidium rhododendri]
MWWERAGIDRQGLSDVAGSASFVVWLFAQSPQLYENYRNSSCEGLSIVFLAQWMAGDVTNLIGCLLTKQLPFQVAVATYFCSIDLCILVQYYYYWYRDRKLERQHKTKRRRGHENYSSTIAPNMRSSSTGASLSRAADRTSSRSPSSSIYRGNSHYHNKERPALRYLYSQNESSSSYKALSETARSVADLANQFAQKAADRDASRQKRWKRKRASKIQSRSKGKGVDRSMTSSEEEEGMQEGDLPGKMMNSLHSESSRSSEEFGYGFGTASTFLEQKKWSKEKSVKASSPISDPRGRDMTRTSGRVLTLTSSPSPVIIATAGALSSLDNDHQAPGISPVLSKDSSEGSSAYPVHPPHSRSLSRPNNSRRSTRSPAASRGAGIVLLGLTALFGMQSRKASNSVATSFTGSHRVEKASIVPLWDDGDAFMDQHEPVYVSDSKLIFIPRSYPQHRKFLRSGPPPHPTWERVVGRISAWICTVLYMTSRLPQIWTNLSRKSVQGLSILLFISAAVGNALYSASVLINPLASGPTRNGYLQESLPFLLGSGGTLIFDAIIVFQWIAWRGNVPMVEASHHHPHHHHHHHHHHRSQSSKSFSYRGSSRTSKTQDSSQRRWNSLERQPLLE